jgi:hypothetical protein
MKFVDQAKKWLSRLPAKTILGGVLVMLLPFLQRLLYLGRIYYYRDFTEVIGARGYFYHQLRQGKLVLWDAFQATGIPFPSYFYDLFNPLSLIYTFFLQDGYLRSNPTQWMLAVHCSLGALGAYLLGLSLKLGRTAAVVMGVIMGCCGVVTIKSVEPMMVHTFVWAPFIFLFLQRARERGLKREGLWAGVFLGFCFMGGHPQIFYYIGVAVLLYALYGLVVDTERSGAREAWSGAFRLYLPLTLSFLLTSFPQMAHQVPASLWGPQGVITAANNRTLLIHSQSGSADFSFLYSFLFPALEGGHGETYFYVGIMPLILAWGAAVYWPKRSGAGFWKILVLVSLLLMMGGNLGIHKILVDILPGFKYFRLPSRWSFLVSLGLLVLSGFGVAGLLSAKKEKSFPGFTQGLAITIGGFFLVMISLIAVRQMEVVPEGKGITPVIHSMTGVILFLAASWFVFRRIQEGETGPALRFLIVAIVVLDLAFYHPSVGVNLNTARSQDDFGPDPSEVTKPMDQVTRGMVSLSEGRPTRFLIDISGVRTPWEKNIHQSALYRYRLATLSPIDGFPGRLFPLGYWQMAWNLKDIPRAINLLGGQFLEKEHPDLAAQRSRWEVVGLSQAAVRLDPRLPVSRLALDIQSDPLPGKEPGTVAVEIGLVEGRQLKGNWPISLEQLAKGGLLEIPLTVPVTASEILLASTIPEGKVKIEKILINGTPVSDTLQLIPANQWLVRNEQALPLAYFVSRAAVLKGQNEYLAALYSMDPSRCVLFREAPPGFRPENRLTVEPGGSVSILKWEEEEVLLQVKAERPGYLVMTQGAYPGWKARIDGKKTPILMAYGFLTALPIGPGNHQVRFTYQEPWVVAGLIISPCWLGGLLFWTVRRKKKRHV